MQRLLNVDSRPSVDISLASVLLPGGHSGAEGHRNRRHPGRESVSQPGRVLTISEEYANWDVEEIKRQVWEQPGVPGESLVQFLLGVDSDKV